MAVEYIYDAIKVVSGEDVVIAAIITDDEGVNITDSCWLKLYCLENDENEIVKVYGAFDGEQWTFTIPSEKTQGIFGRYWYTIGRNFESMSFKSPIYFC